MKVLLAVLAAALLQACAYGGTFNFSGPGTFQDFAKARYQCYANLRSASGAADESGAVLTEAVSCGAMDACMASKGYRRDAGGRHSAKSISVRCH